jgi:hypothetical protein
MTVFMYSEYIDPRSNAKNVSARFAKPPYDPGDHSERVSIGIANGENGNAGRRVGGHDSL